MVRDAAKDEVETEEPILVLNEVTIDRGMSSYLTYLECYCDGSFVTCVQGDGLIISTTSGSTAYSLAAGGSMVHPQVNPHIVSRFCSALQYCVKALQKCVGYSFSLFYIYYVLTLLNNLKDAHVQAPKDTAVVINLLSLFTRNLSST